MPDEVRREFPGILLPFEFSSSRICVHLCNLTEVCSEISPSMSASLPLWLKIFGFSFIAPNVIALKVWFT